MAISGFLFLCWRIWEMIITIPIVGMLGWYVHQFVKKNLITPDYVLVLFIVATLALAWEFFTVIAYLRARHDALFIAFTDLCFIGAFIAGVVVMRFIVHVSCGNVNATFTNTSGDISYYLNKPCSILKASFAFAILCILSFAVTFFLALLVHHHHRNDDRVVVKRETSRTSRHGSRHNSSSRDYRRSRDYDNRPVRSSSGRHSSRRRDWV